MQIDIAAVPAVGTPAPDFTLQSTAGAPVTLSSFKGSRPVLIAFFPLAFTSTCTAELCAFRDEYADFEGTGTMILPISVDSAATLKEFKNQLHIGVELLSDFKREVSAKYGVLLPDRFFANRSYFLVDRDGMLRWVHVEAVPGNKRENAEILAEIAKLG